MRTLVVSDLHLGIGPRLAVLESPLPQARLADAVQGIDRLVLLGDTLELIYCSPSHAMRVAEPILRSIGERLGKDAEVILVPGNHDRPLIDRWLERDSSSLTLDTEVPLDASPLLEQVAAWLAPAVVSVRYPGVWLTPRVWATHGHYLDRHLIPEAPVGLPRGLLRRLPKDQAVPCGYEDGARRPRTALRPPVPDALRPLLRAVRGFARTTHRRTLLKLLLSPRMSPVTASMIDVQMRRATIPALARVVHRLGVDAKFVLFAHVHRLGPLAADDQELWRGLDGCMRVLNTGSWIYEEVMLDRASSLHPYWPGGAILIEDDQPPRPVNLLDDLSAEQLRGAGSRRLAVAR